jgi:PAS domain S-box-containing protein
LPINLRDIHEHAAPFVETQSGRTIRMVSFRRDQSLITVSVSTGFIRDTAAQINGTISVLVDMTAQQNVQAKMLQQNDYLVALHDTALALLNRLDVDELLSAIMQRASTFLNTPDGYLAMLDPLTSRVVLRVGIGFFKPRIGTSTASTDGLIGQVLASKRLYVIDDYTNWARRIDHVPGTHLYAAIGMPLIVGGQVIGVIGLVRLTPNQPFTLDEISQLGQLVELACLALDNAKLYAAAQQELAERSRAEAALQHLNADLEDRIKARTLQLQQRETELRTVLDSMSEGLVYFQTDRNQSRIEFANQAITEIVGYQPADLIGQSFAIFEPTALTDNNVKQDIIQLASNGRIWRSESSWRRADGSRVWVALSVRRVQSSGDNGLRGVMIARDITAEKQLTDQKMRFIANASHELRTPLTHLKTRMYLIRRQPERAAEHLAVLDQSITRMTRLVEDMLDTTRFEHGWGELERRNVIVQDLISELLPNIQSEIEFKKIKLAVEHPEAPLAIQADPNRLMQVLNNLAANAINYTYEGGQIHIRVQPKDQGVIIEFEDSGVGLAPENFERVFEPFFRVELGTGRGVSLGLGLSIAREIVLLHGGSLTVTSQLQKGSIFRVSLPIVPTTLPVPITKSPENEHPD